MRVQESNEAAQMQATASRGGAPLLADAGYKQMMSA